MSTDPKKNVDLKDEELERVAGGAGGDSADERPDPDGGVPTTETKPGKGGRELA